MTRAFGANCAHMLLLALDQPEKSKGEIFNCGDMQAPTIAQCVEVIVEALGAPPLEQINMPEELAVPARPLLQPHVARARRQVHGARRRR